MSDYIWLQKTEKLLSPQEWFETYEEELSIFYSESGMDREMDWDGGDTYESYAYDEYISNNQNKNNYEYI